MLTRAASILVPLALAAAIGLAILATVLLTATPAEARSDYRQAVDITFPVAGSNSYVRDYSFCRSGCSRRHRATDIMAPYGVKVHAAMGGRISFITGMSNNPPSYGYMIRIAGDDGRTYNYIHLGRQNGTAAQAYASGLRTGSRVERGQHIGYNGCSGNASCSAPHLHFEIVDPSVRDPYGSNRMDPYDSLRAAQARGDVPGAVRSSAPEPEPAQLLDSDGCAALTGDWRGSGADGIGWWCDGRVRLRTADGEVLNSSVGRAGDVPVAGDFTGDGVDTVSVVREGEWHIILDRDTTQRFTYGQVSRGDVPVVGDWLGQGRDTVGIIRDGDWHLRTVLAGGASDISFTYGRILQGDRALVGDWTAAGHDRVGIVRGGEWHLRTSLSGGPGDIVYTYGRVLDGDLPVMGDWTGDGAATPGIVRDEQWHLREVHRGGDADQIITLSKP